VEALVNVLSVPVKELTSESRVDEANVQVDVANVYRAPEEFAASAPEVKEESVTPLETVKAEVEACPVTARFVVVALVNRPLTAVRREV